MKKYFICAFITATVLLGLWLNAADHIDAPAVGTLDTGSSSADITDYYAFESPANSDNYVFVCNVHGLTAPTATGQVSFDEDVIYEFNIDNDGDLLEDLVIQAIFRDGKVITYGAVVPEMSGNESRIVSATRTEVAVSTYGAVPNIGENNGVKLFAGPRDDPFFMDFFRFVDIVNGVGASLELDVPAPMAGDTYPTSFRDQGQDTFSGTNVLSVVIEVPKSSLGTSQTFNSWVEAKVKS